MRRREFITLFGSAVAWPLAARAQRPEQMRRIGVLSGLAADDQDNKVRLAAIQQRLQQLGWTDAHNVRIDYRFAAANPENYPKYLADHSIRCSCQPRFMRLGSQQSVTQGGREVGTRASSGHSQ